ncbi:cysteine desulfurase family protein [Catellatospora sichuanensis]|uniref:cysteine desulfurase family protein n=1 Tax=Catellatospora sichuanensis TaxID=1969805 RepID=UPI001FE4F325|nr:cysteine desulfurase family protein [Catellatospora sichuanensis]
MYLDHNATTPLAPGVLDTMVAYLGTQFGNPSSSHQYGQAPRQAVATARTQLAHLLGARPQEIVFTGCGSEANTLAINGTTAGRTGHVITQATEHPAVLETCRALTRHDLRLTVLPVDEYGLVRAADLAAALTPDTILVTVMHANNETGTIQPIAELAALTHRAGALLHTDAAQSVGKIPFVVDELGADLLTVAGHKFGGPKGVGALYIRDGLTVQPLIRGGGQEHGLRSGTENVAGIAGLGAAAQQATTTGGHTHVTELRDQLHRLLMTALGDRVALNGHLEQRLPNTLNISIEGTVGAQLLAQVPQLAASTGSACHDGSISSPVLAAMGLDVQRAAGAIRLSLGASTTETDIRHVADLLTDAAGGGRR